MPAKKARAKSARKAPAKRAGKAAAKRGAAKGSAKKSAAKRATGAKRASAKKSAKKRAKTSAKRAPGPKTGKADGDAPVNAFIASLSGWQRDVAQQFDDIIGREVPGVRRGVRWGTPMYGVEGQGWFAAFGAFKEHVKLNFFKGTSLKPVPPSGTSEQMRALDIHAAAEFDPKLVASWVKQASRIRGWGSG